MNHDKDQILTCDFFTVETLFLKSVYVLFFIEIGSRRVHFAGCTTNPNDAWITQQARQISWNLDEADQSFRHLIRDRDRKFTEAFDTIFRSAGMRIIRTPRQAPNANSHAERYVRSVHSECLDKVIVIHGVNARFANKHICAQYCLGTSSSTILVDRIKESVSNLRLFGCLKSAKAWCGNGQCWAGSSMTTIAWLHRPFSRVDGVFWPYGYKTNEPTEYTVDPFITGVGADPALYTSGDDGRRSLSGMIWVAYIPSKMKAFPRILEYLVRKDTPK